MLKNVIDVISFLCSINETNNETVVRTAHKVCDQFPDENASKTYPLDKVYETVKITSCPSTIKTSESYDPTKGNVYV